MTRTPSQLGRMKRNKGARVEREIVQRHTDLNVLARRVPQSGANNYTHDADVDIYPWGEENGALVAEVKADQRGIPKTVLKWLGENDLLFMKQDRQDPIVVMPWSTYERLVK